MWRVLTLWFLIGLAGVQPYEAWAVPAGKPAPEITCKHWLNSEPLTIAALRGRIVLVEFWTYLCYNCKNVEPWMKQTHVELAPRGVKIIGVHTPEFRVERKTSNVVKYVRENDIVWPVAIDTGWKVWRRYNTTNAWPAFFVYDRNGELVYSRAGERAVTGARTAIETALAEPAGG